VIWREGDTMFGDPDTLLSLFIKENSEYKCYAEHVGKRSGKKHYHCYIRYKTARKLYQMKKKWGEGVKIMSSFDHENCNYIRDQSPESFWELGYKKSETEKNGYAKFCDLITNGSSIREIIRDNLELGPVYERNRHALTIFEEEVVRSGERQRYEGIAELRAWQRHVIDRIEEPVHQRHILWYVDSEGGAGKSTLCRYLLEQRDAVWWCPIGKREDVAYQLIQRAKGRAPKLIICELENKKVKDICWEVIEMAKNGMVSAAKYQGGFYAGQRPHIIIFSNEDIIGNPFTKDRLRVCHINGNEVVKETII